MDLTTLARVKARLELTTTKHDTLLAQFITAVSADAEKFLNRFTEEKARTVQHDIEPGQQRVFLRGFPVLASPAAVIKNDVARDFAAAAAFEADSFYLELETGLITVDRRTLVPGPGTFQVVYTGGMATTPANIIVKFPGVAQAVDIQVAFLFKRKDELGLSGFSAEGGSITLQTPVELIPAAKQALRLYRATRVGS